MALVALRALLLGALLCTAALGGSIEGHITSSATGAGIGGVEVRLLPVPPPATATEPPVAAITGDSGTFQIANVPDGQYVTLLIKDGFMGTVEPVIWNAFRVAGDTRMDLKMTRLASLSGRVVDAEKMPVAGVTVEAEGGRTTKAVTDENGVFVLKNLPPQSYVLSAQIKIPPDAPDGERMVTTFFPSSVDRERAEQINVQALDLPGYDIQLRTAQVRRIRGVVIDVNGEPAAQATVMLLKPGTSEDVEQVLTDDDGAFEFSPVQEGDWKIQAENVPDYDQDRGQYLVRSGTKLVRVSARPPENTEVRLAQPFALRLATDWSGSSQGDAARAHPKVTVGLLPLERQPTYASKIDPSQAQTIEGIFPGRYRISEFAGDGWYLAAAMLDGRDVLGQDMEVLGPGTLKMVYRNDAGSVRGSVDKGGGAVVVALSASGRAFQTPCDSDGRFAIADLPPGEYTLRAFQMSIPQVMDLMTNPERQRALLSRGEQLKVEPGAAASVDLKLN